MMEAILTALLTRCESLSVGSPAIPAAFPERAFTPPADGKYVEVRILPNSPAWEGVGNGLLKQGLLQVDLHWPKNAGLIGPSAILDDIKAHFAKGLGLYSEGVAVTLTNEPVEGVPLPASSELIFPLTIRWSASQA